MLEVIKREMSVRALCRGVPSKGSSYASNRKFARSPHIGFFIDIYLSYIPLLHLQGSSPPAPPYQLIYRKYFGDFGT